MQLKLKAAVRDRKPDLLDPANELQLLAGTVAFLRHHGLLIGLAVAASMTLAMAYIFVTPPVFMGQSELLIEPRRGNGSQTAGDGYGLDTAQIENQVTLLQSEQIFNLVADELGLASDAELGGSAAKAQETSEATRELRRKRQIVENFRKRLEVRRVGLSYTIAIAYRSRSPVRAAEVANAVANAYLNDQLVMHTQAAKQGSQWLEERLDELRKKMNEATSEVQSFRAKRDYRISKVIPDAKGAADAASETTLEELEVKASAYKRIYENHLQSYFDLVHQRSVFTPNARLITHAFPPLNKVQPRPMLILPLALIGGIALGLALAMLLNMFERTKAAR